MDLIEVSVDERRLGMWYIRLRLLQKSISLRRV